MKTIHFGGEEQRAQDRERIAQIKAEHRAKRRAAGLPTSPDPEPEDEVHLSPDDLAQAVATRTPAMQALLGATPDEN